MRNDLRTERREKLPPDPTGVAETIRRIGYDLDDALADIIDNSIDAKAHNVLVRFVRSKSQVERVIVADDGYGMSEGTLHRVMQYGVRVAHTGKDLGKYGIGMKAASLSQCSSVTVVSRKDGKTAGRRWTMESIGEDWRLEVINRAEAEDFYEKSWTPVRNRRHGTLVVWDELLSPPSALGDFEQAHAKTIQDLGIGLGIRFHRFLQGERLRIWLDTVVEGRDESDTQVPVTALDPFCYAASGQRGYPITFGVDLGSHGELKMTAHIWPAKSKDPNYRLGGGKVALRQGFYFYRNDRLISAGGWHKYQSDGEPHSSLARVEIDIPAGLDAFFGLTVQKNDFKVPQVFLTAVRRSKVGNTSFDDYLQAAEDTYRNAPNVEESVIPVPARGIPAASANALGKLLSNGSSGKKKRIDFEWTRLENGRVFDLDRDRHRILLNLTYRSAINGGQSSKADAPLFKTLLFFIASEAIVAGRFTARRREELDLINKALLVLVGGRADA